jgi:hypothetical protein
MIRVVAAAGEISGAERHKNKQEKFAVHSWPPFDSVAETP